MGEPQDELAVMRAVLRAGTGPAPLTGLVEALAQAVNGAALVFGDGTQLLASSGGAPVALVREWLAGTGGDGEIGRWFTAAREIRVGAHAYQFVLAAFDAGHVRDVASPAFEAVEAILGSYGAVDEFSRTQRSIGSAKLLRDLRLGVSPAGEHRAWRRMAEFGFAPYAPLRLAVCTDVAGGRLPPEAVAALADAAATDGLPLLALEASGQDGVELLLALPAETARAGLAAALAAVADRFGAGEGEPGDAADDETASPVAAGLSAAFDQLTRVPEAVRTACTAVEVARRRAPVEADGETGAVATVIAAEELTPAEWLLAANRMRAGREALTGFVAPLGEHPELLETLIVYLRSRMTVFSTASKLRVHENTVRYRLRRIEGLLGESLSDPLALTNLCLSLYPEVSEETSGV
ncbi:CdaR family transcriptional regulator [Corynebacterium frankenforstense]|uniref:PucR family transcriptional regulator n=1 Tax=Corynebacterium frankenforstense TaxID=1230998 RepID=UPI0026F0606A|nr:PucR family transcriptional regulator [Corynebacterium frankenforstense]